MKKCSFCGAENEDAAQKLLTLPYKNCNIANKMKNIANLLINILLCIFPLLFVSMSLSAQKKWSGTGFALNNGYLVTNWHVARNAQTIHVYGIRGDINKKYIAEVVAKDEDIDLAILKISGNGFPGFGTVPYKVRTNTAEVAENVFVLGFPMTKIMGDEMKYTEGVINSLSGIGGDKSTYQISAQVSHGSSGGPVFDNYGNLVGIISSGLDASVQQNVYYAIKTAYLKNLVETMYVSNVLPTNSLMGNYTKRQDKFKAVKNFVFYIECYDRKMPLDDVANRPSYIKASPSSLSFSEKQEGKTLVVSTNAPSWKISSKPDWCMTTNKTTTSVTINALKNDSNESRRGTIVLETSDGKIFPIDIIQSKKRPPYITANPSSVNFDEDGEQKVILITTNSESWTISSKPDWCTIIDKTENSVSITTTNTDYKGTLSGSIIFETSNGETFQVSVLKIEMKGKLNGHEWVDLGLPSGTLWATCNVGANSPEEFGDYFAWGETKIKNSYTKDNYKYSGCPTTLPPSVDAAAANWGDGWHIPTKTQWEELKNKCEWMSGSNGYKIVGPSGKSIFLPAAGFYSNNGYGNANTYGYYWSSTFNSSFAAWDLGFNTISYSIRKDARSDGESVRPVCNPH